MDGSAFDRLTRSLTLAGSRRRALGGLLLGSLGLLGGRGADHADAHNALLACKKKSGKAKKKCVKKAKAHNAQHAAETPPPPAGCPAGLVSCSGQCRLPHGVACNSHAECCSNYCFAGTGTFPWGCSPSCMGKSCTQDADCCVNVACVAGTCGGCTPTRGYCEFGPRCCYTECNVDCLSYAGQRCATHFDCDTGSDCVAGTCTCVVECCSQSDCPPREFCGANTCICPTECCSDDDCFPLEKCLDDGKCHATTTGG